MTKYLGYWSTGYWSNGYWNNGYWPVGSVKILDSSRAITVWGTEEIEFTGADGEWASVIISGRVYRIENDNGNFLWDTLGHPADQETFEQGLDENSTREFAGIWQPYNVTWTGFLSNSHFFTIELLVEDECLRENEKMDESLITPLNEEIIEKNENPTTWADFNKIHKRWKFIKTLGVKGRQTIICQEDIPDEPRLEDYPI